MLNPRHITIGGRTGSRAYGIAVLFTVVLLLAACSDRTDGQPNRIDPRGPNLAVTQTGETSASAVQTPPSADVTDSGPPSTIVQTGNPTETPSVSAIPNPVTPGLPARVAGPQNPTPDRDLAELAVRLRGATVGGNTAAPASQLEDGAQQGFWITNLENGSARGITATLRLVSENAYWFVDDDVALDDNDRISTDEHLSRIAARFEEEVRPAVVGTFGDIANPGLDGDPRLFILYSVLDGAAGYFGSKDSFSTEVHPHSNQREIIYLESRLLASSVDTNLSIIAHELQHAVHLNQDVGEESWVNEGLAELATEVAGFETQSLQAFLTRPQTQLNYWPQGPRSTFPHYGAAALFFAYLSQRIGGTDDLIDLVTEPLDGIEGVDAFLAPHGLTWEQVFLDWIAANYLDADDDRYGYQDRDIRVRPVRTLSPRSALRDHLPQFSARYYRVDSHSPAGTIDFRADTEVRQLGTDCAVGPTCWWSGRGDGIDSRLTREFDLTGVKHATLRYRVWHEIEKGWDFGYVEVSDDGGKTWQIVEGTHTTTENPSGNAYGVGYTGQSRGWKQESIDLTPFTGGRVLIRFEYVTDDAVYLDGLLIDDVAIPELGFSDETGGIASWNVEGFSKAGHRLAQSFVVQIVRIALDGSFSITQVPLDDQNSGQVDVSGLDTDAETIVIVSPTTPGTRHTAGYVLEFAEISN